MVLSLYPHGDRAATAAHALKQLCVHVLLWSLASPERLSPEATAVLQSTDNTLYVSMATLWECSIKVCISKLVVPEGFFGIVAND